MDTDSTSAYDLNPDFLKWLNTENDVNNETAQYGAGASYLQTPEAAPSTQGMQYGSGAEPVYAGPLFTVLGQSERFYKKFNTQGVLYSLDIPQPNPKANFEKWLQDLLDGIIKYFLNNSKIR